MSTYEKFDIPPIRRSKDRERLKKMHPGEYRVFSDNTKAENFRILAWRYGRKPVRRALDDGIRIYVTE